MKLQSVIGSVFAVAAVIVLGGCATGSSIVTGTPRAPIEAGAVKIYLEPPAHYEVIGIVKASSDAGLTEQDSTNYALREIKRRAAKLGANGVLLDMTGTRTASVVGGYGTGYMYSIPIDEQVVQGRAIYVEPER